MEVLESPSILSLPKQCLIVLFGVGVGLASAQHREQRAISTGVTLKIIVLSVVAFNLVLVRGRRHYPNVQAEFELRKNGAER